MREGRQREQRRGGHHRKRRPFFHGALEGGERGRNQQKQQTVVSKLPRKRHQSRRERQQDEGHETDRPAQQNQDPPVGDPEKGSSKDRGKKPQEEFRSPEISPEVQQEKKQRGVSIVQARLVEVAGSRQIRQQKMNGFVSTQGPALRRENPNSEADRDNRRGEEIAITSEPRLSLGRPCLMLGGRGADFLTHGGVARDFPGAI